MYSSFCHFGHLLVYLKRADGGYFILSFFKYILYYTDRHFYVSLARFLMLFKLQKKLYTNEAAIEIEIEIVIVRRHQKSQHDSTSKLLPNKPHSSESDLF